MNKKIDNGIINQIITNSFQESKLVNSELRGNLQSISDFAHIIIQTLNQGGKLIFMGNGGSAAEAQHMAAEYMGRFLDDRKPLPAISLTADTANLTAIGNDYGFENIFARQLEAIGSSIDALIALSTSGKSQNVRAAIEVARRKNMSVIGISGINGFPDSCDLDLSIKIPSLVTARIQESSLLIGHIVCRIVDEIYLKNIPGLSNIIPHNFHQKEIDFSLLTELGEYLRASGKTIVWTNGCFDLLHRGHVESLQSAKSLGDVLVVGINSDESVRDLKGDTRPIFDSKDRMKILSSMSSVDYVTEFSQKDAREAVLALRPQVFCKGQDYGGAAGKKIIEEDSVFSYGGRIELLPFVKGFSTSSLIENIINKENKFL